MNVLRLDISGPEDPFIPVYLAKLTKYLEESDRYYFQIEYGTETGKPHIQGWAIHSKKSATFRDYMNKYIREEFSSKSSVKAHAQLTNWEHERSYLLNNPSKLDCKLDTPVRPIFWTNYTQEELDELIEETPQWIERSVYLDQIQQTKVRKENWSDKVIKRMEETCIITTLKNEKIIWYENLETQMYGLPKSLDIPTYKKLLNGITKRLEEMYPHPENRRVKHMFNQSISNDPELSLIYRMPYSKNV